MELRVAELMKERNIKISELARLTGVPRNVLSEIKNHQRRTIKPEYEIKLARFFCIPISELYTEEVNW
jgi:plasmid maintenance system antidote protein VapI